MTSMNFVMISPHFPANFEPFAHQLKACGFRTLGIADVPYEALSEGLRSALTEYYRVDDMMDYDQVYRAVAYFAHRYGRIDRIESHNEHWLELDAKLRTDFNVFGYHEKDMLGIKTKSQMKQVFRKAGLKVAKGRVFVDEADARALVKELGFPVIIKPDSGVGASDTYKIRSEKDLDAFFKQQSQGVSYIMEEFIDGDIVTFDGLTDHDGKIVFYAGLAYSDPVIDVVSEDRDIFFYVPRELPEDLLEMGKICVDAFQVKERFFHFEFFRVKATGELMPLEINARPPGGLTIDMWNYANDFDIFREYAHIVRDNQFYADIKRPYNCVYMSRKAGKAYKHSLDEIRERYAKELISIQDVPGIFSQILGEFGVLARTESFDEMLALAQFVQEVE